VAVAVSATAQAAYYHHHTIVTRRRTAWRYSPRSVASTADEQTQGQIFAKSNASWSNRGLSLDRRRFRAVGVGSLERSSIKAVRRSPLEANSNQTSAHRMNDWRELSFVAICAHSKDSSAHARSSAAVTIFISASRVETRVK
jgi:hypothetical protein